MRYVALIASAIALNASIMADALDRNSRFLNEPKAEQVNIVVDSFQLVQTSMDKKSFQGYIKIYLKKVKAELEKSNPDRVEPFMTGMKAWVPKMLKEFSEYDFYMGRSCDGDAGYVYAKFGEGASYPTFYMIKDGLLEEKV